MFRFETPEQIEIRRSVKSLAEKILPQFQTEEYVGTVPREIFSAFADIGLTGLSIGDAHGGLAQGLVTSTVVMEELARVDAGAAIFLSVHLMVSGLIERFGSSTQKAAALPDFASGRKLAAFALTESGAGSDAAALQLKADQTADGFELSGSKIYITSAGFADVYLIFARTDSQAGSKGISAFLMPAGTPGLSVGPSEKKMGAELSPIASLHLDRVRLPPEALVGELHGGFSVALGGLAGGRINIAACANGISRAAIERATAHLHERRQFGKALAEFQGLQFMLADMQIRLEAAQLLTWQAAHERDTDAPQSRQRLAPSLAKCFATDAAMAISTDAVQLLGGAGYIKEYGVEKLMRDAKMLQIVEGTNQIQRMIIGRELLAAD